MQKRQYPMNTPSVDCSFASTIAYANARTSVAFCLNGRFWSACASKHSALEPAAVAYLGSSLQANNRREKHQALL
eukprot:2377916-Amphidinium_carterae.1